MHYCDISCFIVIVVLIVYDVRRIMNDISEFGIWSFSLIILISPASTFKAVARGSNAKMARPHIGSTNILALFIIIYHVYPCLPKPEATEGCCRCS